jgi:uncharacterized protein YndB with AHSA1/START domain
MQKLNFSISINAPKEKVWKMLWDDSNYRKWTSAFSEGSYAETDNWKEGSKVLFLDGELNGVVSQVEANKKNEFMSFKHLDEVKKGEEDTTSEKVKLWANAMENYTLKEANGVTDLKLDMDISEEYKDYFANTWPKALQQIKSLSEDNSANRSAGY